MFVCNHTTGLINVTEGIEAIYIPAALQQIYNQKDFNLGRVADLFVTNS